MFHGVRNVLIQFCVTSLLGVGSSAGDRLVESSKNNVFRAFFDNVTHAIVGGLSWILILILSKKPIVPNIYSVIYCTAISSLIDLDHFFAARSWTLRLFCCTIYNLAGKICERNSRMVDIDLRLIWISLDIYRDATHLDKRPFLHSTTVPLLLWILLMTASRSFSSPTISNYAWIVLTSFLSHHIRDGSRRGLWFSPIGTTRPIPYYLYIAFSMGLPYIIYWLMFLTSTPITKDYKYRTIDIV